MAKDIIGQRLPKLFMPSTNGVDVCIPDDLLGSYSVLFFYPKDQTPGCTKEACMFRDNVDKFKELGAKIFGISSDGIESHQKFISKHDLNFPLLSDANKKLAAALGVSSLLGMFSRDTFLIDPEGQVAMLWRKVHATDTVFESLKEIQSRLTA